MTDRSSKKVKEYLSVYRAKLQRVKRLLDLDKIIINRMKYSSTVYSEIKTGKRIARDKFSDGLAKKEEVEKKIIKESGQFKKEYMKVLNFINNYPYDDLTSKHRIILILKYLNGYNLKTISKKIDKSQCYCRRLHGEAIKILSDDHLFWNYFENQTE